ncbi:hypothetical protein BSL82_09410 [Tardibacter chloracetimidivorans]|uniref:Uncharacterized protein n=1 Tax=Tardibacter chloracetimidivorans TaxID=1921510 RepID=A0A1L3ZV58_9SPHN|nr:hypothetical protein [Tardibacter chloracetimidivorans]API59497.1 hypothetical protein BSL82_09410 [Tardibacter chloracetimidivorans]
MKQIERLRSLTGKSSWMTDEVREVARALPDLLSHIDALEARDKSSAKVLDATGQAAAQHLKRAEAAERALADAVEERDALRSASTIIRQRDEAVEAFRAAEHLCDRLRNIAAGKPVRDLEEAEAAFASARAFLTKRGEK